MNVVEANRPVMMRRDNWTGVPEYSLSPEYALRFYQAGDIARWVALQQAADVLNDVTVQTFARSFGHDEAALRQRQYFLSHGFAIIGTATAWWDDAFCGGRWGRVHWVAIAPEFQGRGLAKPLLSAVCRRLRALGHERAYLATSTARLPAINLYRHFGFQPHFRDADDAHLWRELERYLKPERSA